MMTPIRLLNVRRDPFTLEAPPPGRIPRYAILSHTWKADKDDEVLFQDVTQGDFSYERKKAWDKKIQGFCKKARKHGYDYVWIDTCCINQLSSAELSESINSMYRWYQSADRCYVYLTDTRKDKHRKLFKYPERFNSIKPRWFTRGWTLQELLASSDVIFYDKNWERLGNRTELANAIHAFANVPISVLTGRDLRSYSRRERMSWIKGRNTKKPEDIAYCMLGIFNVSLVVNYGEGKKTALRRLKEAVYNNYEEDDGATVDLDAFIDEFDSSASQQSDSDFSLDGVNPSTPSENAYARYTIRRTSPEPRTSSELRSCPVLLAVVIAIVAVIWQIKYGTPFWLSRDS